MYKPKESFSEIQRRSVDREPERVVYLQAKKDLRKVIRTNQQKAWRELQGKVDEDVWGLPYKLVMKKLSKYPLGALTIGRELELAA